ncbi:uncharacterized protein LOC117808790 [Notolabrus celidotus]|uniref:uncharacterized protein LOC117808790 n=1 Tax=Notolabrus celidotus TaxID=1203425 RepID=UPI00148F7DB7|nr:uncharacterized protein LOC117808790 [Notolabrus celidotus]XP_034534341.1 uncharacterized protein LOC117808790 [Notolabrus celidotus]XP_034534342.1 uncharacterized protein LOC117808790 [Notolabrus celidotus]
MASNDLSKFDHINPKVLIRPGSPAIYKLIPSINTIGNIIRFTFGKQDVSKLNKTILLVGETGTGKSTLINALVNYAMGVKWEDNVWFQIVEDNKKGQAENQCESQTSDVNVYEIFGFEGKTLPYSLTIIDTPGYGDTGGIDHDDIVSQRLLELFRTEGGVHEINAVGLVLKSTVNRLDDRQCYIFNAVLSLFGKNMEDSIVALLTHSNGRQPKNALTALEAAKIQCAKDAKGQPVYFLFENCQTENRDEDPDGLEHANDITMKGMRQFAEFLKKSEPKRLKVTKDVLKERENLKSCIKNLRDRVEFIESQQTEIKEKKEALMKHKKEIESNKDFKIQSTEVYKDKESYEGGRRWYTLWLAKSGTLCCTKCEQNCHDPCSLAWGKILCGSINFSDCCDVCTGKCHVSHHVKESWRYVTKTRTVTETCEEMKKKYEAGKAGQANAESLLDTLQNVMKELQKDKDKWLEEAFQHVVNLEKIALNADSLSVHEHLDFLIQRMEEKGDTGKVQKLKEMKSRVHKGIEAGMRYKGVGGTSK